MAENPTFSVYFKIFAFGSYVEAIDWNEDVYLWNIQTGKPAATTPNKALPRD